MPLLLDEQLVRYDLRTMMSLRLTNSNSWFGRSRYLERSDQHHGCHNTPQQATYVSRNIWRSLWPGKRTRTISRRCLHNPRYLALVLLYQSTRRCLGGCYFNFYVGPPSEQEHRHSRPIFRAKTPLHLHISLESYLTNPSFANNSSNLIH